MRHLQSSLLLSLLVLLTPMSGFSAEEADNSVWIDVRSAQEFREGHIEGAFNIPHGDIGHKIRTVVDDPSTEVHLYCASGVFAGLALEILMEMGFEYVVNEGGYQAILERQSKQD